MFISTYIFLMSLSSSIINNYSEIEIALKFYTAVLLFICRHFPIENGNFPILAFTLFPISTLQLHLAHKNWNISLNVPKQSYALTIGWYSSLVRKWMSEKALELEWKWCVCAWRKKVKGIIKVSHAKIIGRGVKVHTLNFKFTLRTSREVQKLNFHLAFRRSNFNF